MRYTNSTIPTQFRRLTPKGAAGDWTRLVNFVAKCASDGVLAVAGKGMWLCDAAPGSGGLPQWPSFSRLIFDDGASVQMTMSGSGGAGATANSAFYAAWVAGSAGATLHTSVTLGSNTLDVDMTAGTFSKGDWIAVQDSNITNVVEIFQIIATPTLVSGARYTLTLHRAIKLPWVTGTVTIQQGTPPRNILIDANGCDTSGTGHRVVELSACQRSIVRGLVVSRNYGSPNWGISFDTGGAYNLIEKCDVDLGGTGSGAAIALESNCGSIIRGCSARNSANTGFFLVDAIECDLVSSTAEKHPYGVAFVPGGSNDVHGHTDCRALDVLIADCTIAGLYAADGDRLSVSNTNILRGAVGILMQPSITAGPNDTKFSNVHIKGTSSDAIQALTTTFQATGLTLEDIGGYGINVAGSTTRGNVSNLILKQSVAGSGPWQINNAAELTIRGLTLTHTYSGNWAGASTANGVFRLNGANMSASGTGTKTFLDMQGTTSGPRVELSDARLSGTWTFGVYAGRNIAGQVWIGHGVDFSGAGTPFSYHSSAFSSRFTVSANGATAVDLTASTPKILCAAAASLTATRTTTTATIPVAAPICIVTGANAARFISSSGDTQPYIVQASA